MRRTWELLFAALVVAVVGVGVASPAPETEGQASWARACPCGGPTPAGITGTFDAGALSCTGEPYDCGSRWM